MLDLGTPADEKAALAPGPADLQLEPGAHRSRTQQATQQEQRKVLPAQQVSKVDSLLAHRQWPSSTSWGAMDEQPTWQRWWRCRPDSVA